jgi:excisionase family DNA binding protein
VTTPNAHPEPAQRVAYRLNEAATALGISRAYLCKLIAAGDIKAVKLGDAVLVPTVELTQMLARLPAVQYAAAPMQPPA